MAVFRVYEGRRSGMAYLHDGCGTDPWRSVSGIRLLTEIPAARSLTCLLSYSTAHGQSVTSSRQTNAMSHAAEIGQLCYRLLVVTAEATAASASTAPAPAVAAVGSASPAAVTVVAVVVVVVAAVVVVDAP